MSTSLRVGELRPSQLQHTFGVGSIVELPHLSVLVMGLDDWPTAAAEPVTEPRLLAAVRADLGTQVASLRTPPHAPETQNPFDDWVNAGVPVSVFPRWLRCPRCYYLGPVEAGLFIFKRETFRPDRVRYVHNCGNRGADALPARFLLACEAGHLDDFPWTYYVHRGPACAAPLLTLGERGTSGEAADVFVRCKTCQRYRPMADAFGMAAVASLPRCRGRHPHQRSFAPDGCDRQVRTISLGASNMWFGERRTVLSIPQAADPLVQRVADRWAKLRVVDSVEELRHVRKFSPDDFAAFVEVKDEELYGAIEQCRSGAMDADPDAQDLLGPEWRAFSQPESVPPGDDFHLVPTRVPRAFAAQLHGVVLARKVREVSALIGFTRISAGQDGAPGETTSERASLSRAAPEWVPCAETRGEGVFLRLDEDRLAEWESAVRGSERMRRLWAGHQQWCRKRSRDPRGAWRGVRYPLLHTLSHALLREFALECGYSAAGIRERLYAEPGQAGVFLYTAAPDSEGTLGGLVRLGEPDILERLLRQALRSAALCSSDPMCSEHNPAEDATAHAAACHACLFASETSCEGGNRFLDRGLLVPTFAGGSEHFFPAKLLGAPV